MVNVKSTAWAKSTTTPPSTAWTKSSVNSTGFIKTTVNSTNFELGKTFSKSKFLFQNGDEFLYQDGTNFGFQA